MMKTAVVVLSSLIIATAIYAADPVSPAPDRRTVLSFATSGSAGDIEGRRTFMNGRYVAIGFFGYAQETFDGTYGKNTGHMTELGAGLRRNFALADQIRPFAQVDVFRSSGADTGGCSASPSLRYGGRGGVEYFVSPRISVEGTAGLAYGRSHVSCAGDGTITFPPYTTTTKIINTFRTALALNFYF